MSRSRGQRMLSGMHERRMCRCVELHDNARAIVGNVNKEAGRPDRESMQREQVEIKVAGASKQ